MKFTCSVEINVPRDFAVQLFSNKDHLSYWQPEFRSVESVEGRPGEPGTKTRMKYQSGKHKFDLIETIRNNDLPNKIVGDYETPGTCWNSMINTFSIPDENMTLWEAEIDYRFHGFMIKLIAMIMPKTFRKQTQKYLDNFKSFAEKRFAGSS